jgi:carnosine N-methyltransferase
MEPDTLEMTQEEQEEEEKVFFKTIQAFKNYRRHAEGILEKKSHDLNTLDPRFIGPLTKGLARRLDQVQDRITRNQAFLQSLIEIPQRHFMSSSLNVPVPTEQDMDKVRSTLRQFVRDWSEDGAKEREACYGPIKSEIMRQFGSLSIEERLVFFIINIDPLYSRTRKLIQEGD